MWGERPWRGGVWGKSKLVKVACSGSLTPRFVNNDYVTAEIAPHSSTLAWKIPWVEEPGRLQSMGSLRVRHDRATSLSLSCIREGNGNPLQCSCLENPRDGGAWWASIYGVAQSRTRLKRLSSSSSSSNSWDHAMRCLLGHELLCAIGIHVIQL